MNGQNGTKDSRLSRIYREGAWPEPSRQIDQAILAASRRASRERHSFAWRWGPPFAVAATVVLTSTLVLKAYREQPEAVAPEPTDASLPRVKSAPTAAESKAAAAEPKAAEAKAAAPQPVETPRGFSSTMDPGEAERLERAQRDIGFKQAAPPSESPQQPAKSVPTLKKEAADPAQRRTDIPQRARAPASPPPAPATISVFGAPPPAQAAAPQAPRAALVAKPAQAFTQGAPASAQAAPLQPQVDRMQASAPAQPAAASASVAAPQIPKENVQAAAQGAAVARSAESSAAVSGAIPVRSPQSWIEDIRKLMAEGKSEEAGREIAEFKKRYPDYALPEDLR